METTRVEVLSAHFYDRDRQPGERYDCANQYLPVVLGRGLVRIVDQDQVVNDVFNTATNPESIEIEAKFTEIPLKRKRGRPFGSHGPYKKRSVVSETSVDR